MASPPELLALHAVRLKGMAGDATVAARFGLDVADAREHLLDFAANGWVRKTEFAGTGGWFLTDAGRLENERMLREELAASGQEEALRTAYAGFGRWNERLVRACTNWQLRPTPWDSNAVNDHSDWRWDERVMTDLQAVENYLGELTAEVSSRLSRFDGYDRRFASALSRVNGGARQWVDQPGIDSCHLIWFELHEDLLATLGVSR